MLWTWSMSFGTSMPWVSLYLSALSTEHTSVQKIMGSSLSATKIFVSFPCSRKLIKIFIIFLEQACLQIQSSVSTKMFKTVSLLTDYFCHLFAIMLKEQSNQKTDFQLFQLYLQNVFQDVTKLTGHRLQTMHLPLFQNHLTFPCSIPHLPN